MTTIIKQLREWAQEIAGNKAEHPTWREDAGLLNKAAKEIEDLREETKRLKERLREASAKKS
jgi:vacuolar-type H+-ATPase subunit I/STV1